LRTPSVLELGDGLRGGLLYAVRYDDVAGIDIVHCDIDDGPFDIAVLVNDALPVEKAIVAHRDCSVFDAGDKPVALDFADIVSGGKVSAGRLSDGARDRVRRVRLGAAAQERSSSLENPFRVTTSTTANTPSVRVPVLSNTTVSTFVSASI